MVVRTGMEIAFVDIESLILGVMVYCVFDYLSVVALCRCFTRRPVEFYQFMSDCVCLVNEPRDIQDPATGVFELPCNIFVVRFGTEVTSR